MLREDGGWGPLVGWLVDWLDGLFVSGKERRMGLEEGVRRLRGQFYIVIV